MAAKNQKISKEAKSRVRDFQARNQAHQHRLDIIKRDNIIAIILAIVAIAAVLSVQFWLTSPGEPTTPTTSPTPTDQTEEPSDDLNTGEVPDPEGAEDRLWEGSLEIDSVSLGFELYGEEAPQAVSSFIHLSQDGFFDGLSCHRLTNYDGMKVLQCGDPAGNGTGGPEYRFGPIENDPEDDQYPAGAIAMARQSNNAHSMGSQFFIVLDDSEIPSDSAGGYTVFGKVTSGLDDLIDSVAAQGIVNDAPDGKPIAAAVISTISVE